MIEITGRLLNNRCDQTRVYEIRERNIRMYVCYDYDESFVRSNEMLDVPGVYVLLWHISKASSVRDIYIGQTSSLSRRFIEHLKTKSFECACLFSTIDGRLTKTEILYLEYLAIVSALEFGCAHLMENYQIPKQPDISLDDMRRMDEFFDSMRLLVAYAGYSNIFEKLYVNLRDAGDSTVMMKRLINSASSEVRSYTLFDENDGIEHEDKELISYEVKGNGYEAKVIPTANNSSFFIMPNSKVAPYVDIDGLKSEARNSLEIGTRSFPNGMMVSGLAEAAEIITGRCDPSVWTVTRMIV